MTDETTTVPAAADVAAPTESVAQAVAAGIEQATLAALPTIAIAASASNPSLQAAFIAAQALKPTLDALLAAKSAGAMTEAQVDAALASMQQTTHSLADAWAAEYKAFVVASTAKAA